MACMSRWVLVGCLSLLAPLVVPVPVDKSRLSLSNTSSNVPRVIPFIYTRCQHKLRSVVQNRDILITGIASDTIQDICSKFQKAGHRVSFLSLVDSGTSFVRKHETYRVSREPEDFRDLLIARGKLPDEVHVICDISVSGSRDDPSKLASFLKNYISLLQGLSLEPGLRNLPVFVHLVGTARTKTKDNPVVEDDCITRLDYTDMRSLILKQVELYSNVFKSIHNLEITLWQR